MNALPTIQESLRLAAKPPFNPYIETLLLDAANTIDAERALTDDLYRALEPGTHPNVVERAKARYREAREQ